MKENRSKVHLVEFGGTNKTVCGITATRMIAFSTFLEVTDCKRCKQTNLYLVRKRLKAENISGEKKILELVKNGTIDLEGERFNIE